MTSPIEPAIPATGRPALPPWWRRAPALSLWFTLLVLGLALAWPLLRGAPPPGAAAPVEGGLPWQIQPLEGGGSRVFGLSLGRSTLAELEQRFGDDVRIALVAAPGQAPALEGYVESFQAGFIAGKLVLAFDADADWLRHALGRATRHETSDGRTQRFALAADDLPVARSSRLAALSFLPSARLDEATVVLRFGEPAERHVGASGEVQSLYPALGLAIALPPAEGPLARSRAVLQYVVPADFERRLRAPLLAASAAVPAH